MKSRLQSASEELREKEALLSQLQAMNKERVKQEGERKRRLGSKRKGVAGKESRGRKWTQYSNKAFMERVEHKINAEIEETPQGKNGAGIF